MYPSFHAASTHMNSTIENPTRNAKARAMLLAFAFPSCLSFSPPLNMKNMAVTKLPRMAMKPKITRYVISEIIA